MIKDTDTQEPAIYTLKDREAFGSIKPIGFPSFAGKSSKGKLKKVKSL